MGSWAPATGLDIPINGLFVLGLTLLVTCGVLLALYKSRWGLRVRATVSNRTMANAIGINTSKTDRLTFAIGCGIAGVAGAAFTTIGSTGPTSGSLYIVDSFLVVTFGGAASLLGTVASALRHRADAVHQRVLHQWLHGQGTTLSLIVVILMIRPQGLFAQQGAPLILPSILESYHEQVHRMDQQQGAEQRAHPGRRAAGSSSRSPSTSSVSTWWAST